MTAELRTIGSTYDDWERFSESLKDLFGSRLRILGPKSAEEVERMAGELQEIILEACEKSHAEEKSFQKVKSVVNGRIDKDEKRGEPEKENDPSIKRIKKLKD